MKKLLLFMFSMLIILNVYSQDINLDEYGGEFSYGIALGGGGLGVGVPLRFYISPIFAIETGVFIRPVIVSANELDIYTGLSLVGGPTVYFSKLYKPYKEKTVLNGISIKGGYCFN